MSNHTQRRIRAGATRKPMEGTRHNAMDRIIYMAIMRRQSVGDAISDEGDHEVPKPPPVEIVLRPDTACQLLLRTFEDRGPMDRLEDECAVGSGWSESVEGPTYGVHHVVREIGLLPSDTVNDGYGDPTSRSPVNRHTPVPVRAQRPGTIRCAVLVPSDMILRPLARP